MNFIYVSQGFTIYPHRQVIEKNGETIQVRSKTFCLLLLLLEKPQEVLGKSYLLNTIWDDVTVEEQVLVQSIRELRQLFGNAEIIQTYPRKGYSWSGAVDKKFISCEQDAEEKSQGATIVVNNAVEKLPFWKRKYPAAAIVTALLLISIGLFYKSLTAPLASSQAEVVMVMPVKNEVDDEDHNWVPLGGMEQLIHLLVSDNTVQVMSSDYVLQAMGFAHLPRNYESQQAAKIFDVSGATLIIESQLSGYTENYQLNYKIRAKTDVKRGVLFDRSIPSLMRQLAQIIGNQTGQKLQNADNYAQTAFTNELMARALDEMDTKQFGSAQNMLVSLKQLEPTNVMVREKLIDAFIRGGKPDEAMQEIKSTLELANPTGPQNFAKIHFLAAKLNMKKGAIDDALKALDQADAFAEKSHDILYQAAISGMRGDIFIQRKAFEMAKTSFEQSMNYNSLIRCPIGISLNHIKLATIYSQLGKQEQALEHYVEAKKLIETNQFSDLNELLASAKPDVTKNKPI